MSVPAETWQLPEISPRAFQHPADRAATAALQQVPYLDAVVRRLIQLGYERALRQANLGASVRLGQEQLPHIWVLHRLLDEDALRAVLAHEAAHVLSEHVLYQTAKIILVNLTNAARLPLLAGLPLMAIRTAL